MNKEEFQDLMDAAWAKVQAMSEEEREAWRRDFESLELGASQVEDDDELDADETPTIDDYMRPYLQQVKGFDTKATLDCGCFFWQNSRAGVPVAKLGDYYQCGVHSQPSDEHPRYDPDTGDRNLQRDRRVVKVEPVGGTSSQVDEVTGAESSGGSGTGDAS